jgi:hypothetical protein
MAGGSGGGTGSTWHCRNAISRSMTGDTVSNQRRLPDPEICRTRYLGQPLDFSKCLVKDPNGCEYAVRYGSGIYCHHADRRSFEKTPGLTRHMNSQAETASDTTRPQRPMTAQHRRNLSRSMKKWWARRGGLSDETRQKISASVTERWAERGRMPHEH